jgi:integrase
MNINLYKRNKRWHYRIYFHNKEYRGSTYTETKELAKLYAQKIYNEFYVNKHHIKYSNVLLSEFIQFHLNSQENNLSDMWLYTKKQLLKKFLTFAQEHHIEFIHDVSVEFLEKYKLALLKNNKPKTVKNTLGIIHTLFKHATKLKYLHDNPVTQLDVIRGIQKNKQRYLTKEEAESILKASEGHYFKDLIKVGIYTGMRDSAINNCS